MGVLSFRIVFCYLRGGRGGVGGIDVFGFGYGLWMFMSDSFFVLDIWGFGF